MADYIDRQAAIDMLWKALYDYEDKTEKQFQESDELDIGDWFGHRIFVQNMNDIDRQTILEMPSADVAPVRRGRWINTGAINILTKETRQARYCSVCKSSYFRYDQTDNVIDHIPNFCPNCGADMRGAKGDE